MRMLRVPGSIVSTQADTSARTAEACATGTMSEIAAVDVASAASAALSTLTRST